MKKFIVVILSLFFFSHSFAQIPQTMSYQGVLTNSDGSTVPDGSYSLTFKLYDTVAGGDSLWQEAQNVQVSGGLFNTILGSVTPLNIPFDKQYWLGISIGNETELIPRTALTASPYSLNSHSTLAETQPGQGLTIRDLNGYATHQFDATGDVTHNGVGKFLGGIVVGDTIFTPLDTVSIKETTTDFLIQSRNNLEKADLKNIGVSAGGSEYGVAAYGISKAGVQGQTSSGIGVWGISGSGSGVKGNSTGGIGVEGSSTLNSGVYGFSSNLAGIRGVGFFGGWFQNKVKIDEVPLAPNQGRFLVWDDDNVVKYRSLPVTDGFDGVLQDKALVIKSGQTEVFRVDTNGNSYHKGVETFEDDVIFKGTDGKGAKLVDGSGVTIGGFGRKDLDTGQRFGVYGKAQNPGDLAGVFDGDVEVDGEIVTGSLHIVDGSGDTLTSFNADGTSLHTGLETYLAGIDLPDHSIENTTGNVKAGKFNGSLSNLSALNKQKFPSIVEVPNLETGTISFNPDVDNEPVIWGYTERTSGPSVFGQNTNTTNIYPAVWGANFGGGAGVVGEVRTTSSNYPGMWAITYGTGTAFLIDHQGSSGNILTGRSSGVNQVRIDKTGKGFFNGGTQTGGADVAEAFEVEGIVKDYAPGDVMVISKENDRTMTKSTEQYSTLVAGVYATKPGVLLTERNIDDSHDDTVPLGVVGVIPTKVSSENGSIRRGDLLVTSSIPGHAMKGTDRDKMMGAVLGKALENFDGGGTGVIKVLVNTK